MQKLKNKVAVITGGSSGIGLETAKKFVAEGAYVFITGRRQSELDKAKKEIGSNVTTVQGDISNLDDLDKLYTIVKKEKGTIDILVSSAGFVEMVPPAMVTPEHFDKTFNTNARGTFFAVQKALPLFNNNSAIVLVASGVSIKGFPQYVTYSATKAAIRSYVRSWAADAEFKTRNIRINAISPGAINTPILDGQFNSKEEAEGAKSYFASITPIGRIGKPEEMASTILFLSSEDSSYITGADIAADGGFAQV